MSLTFAHSGTHVVPAVKSRSKCAVAPLKAGRNVSQAAGSQMSTTSPAAAGSFDLETYMLAREERAKEREAQRQAAHEAAATGVSWWHKGAPGNMALVQSAEELQRYVEYAAAVRRLLVVNFFGEQCYACKSLYPKLCQIARDNYDVLFVKVNLTQAHKLNMMLQEQGHSVVPLFQLYQDGAVVSQFTASLNPQKLAVLRAEIAANKGSGLAGSDAPVYATLEA